MPHLLKITIDSRGTFDIVAALMICLVSILIGISEMLAGFSTIIGWFVTLFLSGYSFISIIFPSKQVFALRGFSTTDNISGLSILERVVSSLFSSLAIVSLSSILLGSIITPSGLGFVVDISGITLILAFFALTRRLNTDPEERFTIEMELDLSIWSGTTKDLASVVSVIALLLVSSGFIIFEYSQEKIDDNGYTELYFSDLSGNAIFPDQIDLFEPSDVYISVSNNEYEARNMTLIISHSHYEEDSKTEISINSTPLNSFVSEEINFLSSEGEIATFIHEFSLSEVGIWSIEAQLFSQNPTRDEPHREIRLWVQVSN